MMQHARVVFIDGTAGHGYAVQQQCRERGVELGPERSLVFVGPGVLTEDPEGIAADRRLAAVAWQSDPLDTGRLRRWLQEPDGQPGDVIFALFHGPREQGPPRSLVRWLGPVAVGRSVIWVAYSHERGADPRFDRFARVLEHVNDEASCRSWFADLVEMLVGPQLVRAAGEVLISLVEWDIELQRQMERRDKTRADGTNARCQAALKRVAAKLVAFTACPEHGDNPVAALEWLVRSLGREMEAPKDRPYAARYDVGPAGQFATLRHHLIGFKYVGLPAPDAFAKRFEDDHARLEDLRDLLLHLIRDITIE